MYNRQRFILYFRVVLVLLPYRRQRMKNYQQEIYRSMVRSLNDLDLETLPEHESAAKAFMICLQHWSRLQSGMVVQGGLAVTEEVYFFKCVKPLFTGRIEYFTKVYQGLAFLPADPIQWREYWLKEADRLRQFRNQYEDFVAYYRSGATHLDKEYFSRSPLAEIPVAWRTPFDAHGYFSSTHDSLVAQQWAHERYHEYVAAKLRAISPVQV